MICTDSMFGVATGIVLMEIKLALPSLIDFANSIVFHYFKKLPNIRGFLKSLVQIYK